MNLKSTLFRFPLLSAPSILCTIYYSPYIAWLQVTFHSRNMFKLFSLSTGPEEVHTPSSLFFCGPLTIQTLLRQHTNIFIPPCAASLLNTLPASIFACSRSPMSVNIDTPSINFPPSVVLVTFMTLLLLLLLLLQVIHY